MEGEEEKPVVEKILTLSEIRSIAGRKGVEAKRAKAANPPEPKQNGEANGHANGHANADLILEALRKKGEKGNVAAAKYYHQCVGVKRAVGLDPQFLEQVFPSTLGGLCVPAWDNAWHIWEMEQLFLSLQREEFRRLMISIPIRHGKSEYANLLIAWLLIRWPKTRILRVMASADTALKMARDVLKYIERWGEYLNGVRLDKRRAAAEHFETEAGGMLRSVGAAGDVESWTFDWIIIDDLITDPYEIRSPNRRDQLYKDLQTKFFSRVNPLGNTKFVVIGSRRHPDDPQGRLLDADRKKQPEPYDAWYYHYRPALFDEGTDHESCLWPNSKEFTVEGLKAIRDQKIADDVYWEWLCNFQNDPISCPDMLIFDPSWFGEDMFYPAELPRESLEDISNTIIAFDPSFGDGSDPSCHF